MGGMPGLKRFGVPLGGSPIAVLLEMVTKLGVVKWVL